MSYGTRIEVAAKQHLAADARHPAGCAGNVTYPAPVPGARVRIHTLGRFSVAIDGRQMCSAGKAKQRPLALLKALIALGGRSVASSQLWECLWPDSEGDLAVRNLTVTLHRLRHMLGTNASVLQHDGKLTLNDRVCWVDAWSYERVVNECLGGPGEGGAGDALARQLRTALDLYTGHFLARESEESWMLAMRLRLRLKFERLVAASVARLGSEGAFAAAIDLCLQALERDPLNETLHRSLLCCYLKCGELAEAMRAYLRCREALAAGLGAAPSMQTQRLYIEAVQASASAGHPVPLRLRAGAMVPAVHGHGEKQVAERQGTGGGLDKRVSSPVG
ncbi:MAG: AfsR/SARP family transcriptional regulator [Burkholderiales bacterium]